MVQNSVRSAKEFIEFSGDEFTENDLDSWLEETFEGYNEAYREMYVDIVKACVNTFVDIAGKNINVLDD
jgi:hypothetical protein